MILLLNIMEESIRRFDEIILKLEELILESSNSKHLHKKYNNYKEATVLISEAKNILDVTRNELNNMKPENFSKIKNTNEIIDLLSISGNFSVILKLVGQLKNIMDNFPSRVNFSEDMQNDIITNF